MRNAPPVLVPVGRFVWGQRLVLAGGFVSALVCAVVVWLYRLPLAQAFVLLAVWACAAGLAWATGRRAFLQAGELFWDGDAWSFRPGAGAREAVELELCWDAGHAMLLRLHATGPGRWTGRYTWLQLSQMPLQWHGLRCAVHGGDTL